MSRESVSVIVPAFNCERLLPHALDSIFAQTRVVEEIIVIDDGSTDGTALAAARFGDRVRLLHQENKGPAAARNRGLQEASGALVAFLDGDDLWPTDSVAQQVSQLAQHPNASGVWGLTRLIIEPGGRPPLGGKGEDVQRLIVLGSMTFRKDVFAKIGIFADELRFGEDLDLIMRIAEAKLDIIQHDHVVLSYRRHAGNMTNDLVAAKRAPMEITRRSVARRRAAAEVNIADGRLN